MDSLAVWLQIGLRKPDSIPRPVSFNLNRSHIRDTDNPLKRNGWRSQKPQQSDTLDHRTRLPMSTLPPSGPPDGDEDADRGDLPDIVGIVMEMGRAGGDAPSEASFAP